ncbi:hypothetical protein SAMN04488096_104293 [Mesonia phycicola]|uniref:Thrombospondin type 3 repeat-containing protein n=1 Tax=Mesonia phycicola TaxID=579105 RepID=A0A1M6E127_9FLAO|nr:hypothetical protein [Mesonia phycicola]SHI79151.1 hypothetical protein SAMN04488096_104293 [Mesonia phycicola]
MIKKVILLLVTFVCLTACDDGDIIVTTFDYDSDTDLSYCTNALDTTYLVEEVQLYNINDDTNESIVFNFSRDGFTGTFDRIIENGSIVKDSTITIDLSTTNKITYRIFDGEIPSDYYCQSIPPSSPQVTQEYSTLDGGTVTLNISVTYQDDDDGIPTEANASDDYSGPYEYLENDNDGDGLPDPLDEDDDNDNVSTATEISENIEGYTDPSTGLPDTDEDGILNYLDNDDDNDGVLTRNEDLNAFDNENVVLNPTDDFNAEGIPYYLDENSSTEITVDQYKSNTIDRTFKTTVVANNITLENSSTGEQITLSSLILGSFEISTTLTVQVIAN